MKNVPTHVRAHIYLFWVGAVAAALGILGFFLSFNQVGSPALAAIDVHDRIPVFAYASIGAWLVGLVFMWYSRRRLNAAVAKKLAADRGALLVDVGSLAAAPNGQDVQAPDGRET